jgi:hypothetical protein
MWRVLGSIVIVIVFLALATGSSDSGSSGQPRPEHDALSAWVMCQQFIEERLKAPKSADFPAGYDRFTTDLGDGRYRVKAYVDAQNSFGAEIRTNFECTVRYSGNQKWTLEDLKM